MYRLLLVGLSIIIPGSKINFYFEKGRISFVSLHLAMQIVEAAKRLLKSSAISVT